MEVQPDERGAEASEAAAVEESPSRQHPSREKILDVAAALFARSGYDGVGLREVSQRSGLSKSSLFHHFPNKAELYFSVMIRLLGRIDRRIEGTRATTVPAEARLLDAIDAVVDELAEQPETARLVLRALVEEDPELELQAPRSGAECDALIMRIVDTLQQLMREGIERGEFREVSVPDATHTLIGALVFYFASGEIGERVGGGSLFAADAIRRRKHELREFARRALAADPA